MDNQGEKYDLIAEGFAKMRDSFYQEQKYLAAYEAESSDMLNQALNYYSLDPSEYEKYLKQYNFKIILKESDQPTHLVWIAQKLS